MKQDPMDRPTNNDMRTFNVFFFFHIYGVTRIMHQCPLYHYFSYQLDAILILFLFISLSNALFCFSSIFFFRVSMLDPKRNRIALRVKTVIITKRTFLRRKRKDDGTTNTIISVIKKPHRKRKTTSVFNLIDHFTNH